MRIALRRRRRSTSAARMFDGEPRASRAGCRAATTSTRRRLRSIVYLDPMHDHLTGASFQVSAAGVQRDAILYNDTRGTTQLGRVWQSAVSVDEQGWTAELRIPLSQLRFTFGEHQTWGINVERFIRRKNERDWLELVPKNENGLASRMAHLTGLDGIRPRGTSRCCRTRAARAEFVEPARVGQPVQRRVARLRRRPGLDLKWGLTSNLTLERHRQPGLRPGRGRSGGRQPHAVRDLLPGEAAVLPRGLADLRQLRPRRRQQLLGLQQVRAADLLLAAHRPAPQVSASGDFVDRAVGDHHPRRGEAHRQDAGRVEPGAA